MSRQSTSVSSGKNNTNYPLLKQQRNNTELIGKASTKITSCTVYDQDRPSRILSRISERWSSLNGSPTTSSSAAFVIASSSSPSTELQAKETASSYGGGGGGVAIDDRPKAAYSATGRQCQDDGDCCCCLRQLWKAATEDSTRVLCACAVFLMLKTVRSQSAKLWIDGAP